MPKHALRRVMASTAAVAGALALSFTGAAAHAAEPLDYVALGDSYSAGSGVLPVDPSNLLCLRSTANYPHVIASATGARLTDVTCGAAQTSHFTQAQYPGVAPQVDALGAGTDLVTLTIGGNDNGTFINAVTSCGTAGLLSGGKGSPCKDRYGSRFEDEIEANTYPALKAALNAVRAEAPGATVAALGYPWIMPAAADPSCFVKLPVAQGDVPYLRGIQARLNAAVRRAAEETGAVFVDFARVSEGHDACAARGTRWIEPLLFGDSLVPVHPNALGERRMAEHAMDALGLG
ncbi:MULTISPECIES: SGNH/GDSL hydrolase family protein [Streptomyces]|uniref:Lysophospholipase L1-like esterase n=2 Tax=Streptomyces TaxID=1883 RepID=A0ABT9L7D8_STRGD|nr:MULTISPECIES: SGNH/GDSL hydrolase family protein [Streptomyces]MDP9679564.1 lysophospholipase L1-like esterase [Streptomyces griseoviridis]GGT00204.1 lipase 2 [Streptomyces griseoviridis]GGU24393.1 lipase 2 [Streptomyces daghestanicus]GHI29832.1 lipase 2 [Streptomyces daghestanicus]